MRDSVLIYRSFYEASQILRPEAFKEFWMALFEYALNDEIPEFKDGAAEALFIMAQPQIDANNKKYISGLKGGAPKGNQNAKKQPVVDCKNNQKQPQVDCKNNQKQPNDNVNDNENVNVNEKRNIKEKTPALIKNKYGERENVLLTEKEYLKLGVDYGESKRALMIKRLDEYIVDNPKYKTQKDHNLAIRRWVAKAIEEDRQRPHKKTPGDLMMNHNYTPEEYAAQEKALLAID